MVRREAADGTPTRALVMFRDGLDGKPWLKRLLRPGFHHVFALLDVGGGDWLYVDPQAHRMAHGLMRGHSPESLAEWYREHCAAIVLAPVVHHEPRPLPPAPWTCVEAVKRALGLRAPAILTPYQLFRHLKEMSDVRDL